MQKKTFLTLLRSLTLTLVASVALGSFAAGCSGNADNPESIAGGDQAKRVDEMKQMRAIFDGARGSWDAVSESDKATYTKLAGGEEKAKILWETMGRNGSAGGPGPGGPGTGGPTGGSTAPGGSS